jgi:hypothetical protein
MAEQVRPLTEGTVDKGGRNSFPSQISDRPATPAAQLRVQQPTLKSKWAIGDRVQIDGCDSVVGTVTGFCFRLTRDPTIEISYFHNGDAKSAWVEEFRISNA